MNTFKRVRQLVISLLASLLFMSPLGYTGHALAAQNNSDIAIRMIADKNQVKVGQNITFTVTMTNLGSSDASFVDVGFSLPDQLNLVSISCDKGISPDTPFCEYSSLASGETVVSILVATPNPSAQKHAKYVTTTSSVSFETDCNFDPTNCTFDPNNTNNLASITTKLIGKSIHP